MAHSVPVARQPAAINNRLNHPCGKPATRARLRRRESPEDRTFVGMSRAIAVFDIDGTVADARHRLHLIGAGAAGADTTDSDDSAEHEQWVRFFDAAVDDPPLPEGVAKARQLAEVHDIVWLTG